MITSGKRDIHKITVSTILKKISSDSRLLS